MKRYFMKMATMAALVTIMVSGCGNNRTEVQNEKAVESVRSYEKGNSLVDSVKEEENQEELLEQEATDAIQQCWNFAEGKMQDGATRELLNAAVEKINACKDSNFKNSLQSAVQAVDQGLSVQEEQDAERIATEAIQKCWNFSEGTLKDGTTRALFDDAKNKINACDSAEFKNSLQPAINAVDHGLTVQEIERSAEQTATEAIQKCWNFSGGTLQNGATRELLNDAKNKIDACNSVEFKNSLQAAIIAVDQALSEQEKEQQAEQRAMEAIQKCWDFSGGKLQDSASRTLLSDAKKKINACSNEEFKNSLQPAITATDQALTAQEEAKRQQQELENNSTNYSSNNSYNDDSNWDAYQDQKERDWDQYQREKEESYQRNRGKSYEERRKDYDRVYQENQQRREQTYNRYH